MYITWLGHSCFRLESAGYGLVIDPYRVVAGYPPLRVEANAVYISHHHFDHDCLEAVTLLPLKTSAVATLSSAGVTLPPDSSLTPVNLVGVPVMANVPLSEPSWVICVPPVYRL